MTVASPLSPPLAIEYEAFANGFAFRFRPHYRSLEAVAGDGLVPACGGGVDLLNRGFRRAPPG